MKSNLSPNARIESIRRHYRAALSEEHLLLISILFGERSITDFYSFSSKDLNQELRMRNIMAQSRIRSHKEKNKKLSMQSEAAFLEQLKHW